MNSVDVEEILNIDEEEDDEFMMENGDFESPDKKSSNKKSK